MAFIAIKKKKKMLNETCFKLAGHWNTNIYEKNVQLHQMPGFGYD